MSSASQFIWLVMGSTVCILVAACLFSVWAVLKGHLLVVQEEAAKEEVIDMDDFADDSNVKEDTFDVEEDASLVNQVEE